jgi:Tol biopolymer transport system component
MRRSPLAAALAALAIASSLALAGTAAAASLPSLIAFSFHGGVGVVRPCNPGSEHLIAHRAGEAAWSPNGQVLAFDTFSADYKHTWMTLVDRGEETVEKVPVSVGGFPTWAPNGREIAYICADGERYVAPPVFPGAPQAVSFNICVVDVVTGSSRVLATGNAEFFVSPSVGSGFLSWSPRTNTIVMEALHSEPCPFQGGTAYCGQEEIDQVDADTGAWSRVVATPSSGAPAISPKGDRLAYRDPSGLYVASASGANPRLVTSLVPSTLAWAPNGKDLVISSSAPPAKNGNDDLFELSLNGGHPKQYTKTGDSEQFPSWAQAVTRCTVPKLKGQGPSGAKRLIALAGCDLGKVTGRRKGKNRKVVSQSPAAGANVRVGTKVNIRFH